MNTHSIFVTVEEFLQNGGELDRGRFLFLDDKSHRQLVYGEFESLNNTNVLLRNAVGVLQFQDTMIYVEIEVKPIYK